MDKETLQSLRENRELIYRDWDWWSWFLARSYFGASTEAHHWDATAHTIVNDLDLQPGMQFLDLGSGCGELEMRLAQRGMDVLGIDNSQLLIRDCLKIALNRGIPAQFQEQNMFSFTTDTCYDAIVCINTSFGYGSDEENRSLFGKVAEWLKPNGQFYLDLIVADNAESFGVWSDYLEDGTLIVDNSYDPAKQMMTSWPHWIAPDDKTIYCVEKPEQVTLYTVVEIESMFEEAGLKCQALQVKSGIDTRDTGPNITQTWIARSGE